MNAILTEREKLTALLTDTLGDIIQIVTTDAAEARPTPDHVAVLIEPPELAWPSWDETPVINWTLDLIAGTTATQAQALDLITDALQLLAANTDLNVNSAQPATFMQPNGGTLASYQLRLNPLEL